jgi:hypothetical protein
MTDKPYHQMTPAERIADRISKNKEIDARVEETRKKQAHKAEVRRQVKLREAFRELLNALPVDAQRDLIGIWNAHMRPLRKEPNAN